MKERKWITDKQEIERNALELHAYRIFDNPLWVDFVPFNEKYRPEVLENADLVWVVNEINPAPQRIPREKMERDNATSFHCHVCGKWIEVKNQNGGTENENNPG